jgi:hypothetical protein
MDPAELEKRTRELFIHFDALDIRAIKAVLAGEAQGVDELSKKWLRGTEAFNEYFGSVVTQLADVRSELSDFTIRMHGDIGVVTFMLEQSYSYYDKPHRITSPSTAIWIRENDDWKIALIHSVGIPDA